LEFIEAGLKKFAKTYRRQRIVSIAFPPLGCGHGGLKWHHVEPLMRRYLEPLENIEIFFCLGTSKAPQSPARSRRRSQANEMAAGTKAGQRGLWADEP